MRINNTILYKRELDLAQFKGSLFLFGPRMTGKTALLTQIKGTKYIDLLDPEIELKYRGTPKLLWEEISALTPGSLVILDEIQKVPLLLDYVQLGIEKLKLSFILSGSSARKLRRGGANLLGGRALETHLHSLTAKELDKDFSIKNALTYGTLPKVSSLLSSGNEVDAQRLLRSYYTIYLKEEIQAEAIVRNLDAFQRFLAIAAQSNGQIIEFANISRESSVSQSTVKDYYQILEDTLIGRFVWPWDKSERKKARPKFYFFDCGVVRALQNRVTFEPTPEELGILFETWFINELIKIKDYQEKEHQLSLWRDGRREVDVLIEDGRGPLIAFECKAGKQLKDKTSLRAFKNKFTKTPLYVVSLKDDHERLLEDDIMIIPWKKALELYRGLK